MYNLRYLLKEGGRGVRKWEQHTYEPPIFPRIIETIQFRNLSENSGESPISILRIDTKHIGFNIGKAGTAKGEI
jgi:hypothetical protein